MYLFHSLSRQLMLGFPRATMAKSLYSKVASWRSVGVAAMTAAAASRSNSEEKMKMDFELGCVG